MALKNYEEKRLPLEYPLKKALLIYLERLKMFFGVVLGSFLIFVYLLILIRPSVIPTFPSMSVSFRILIVLTTIMAILAVISTSRKTRKITIHFAQAFREGFLHPTRLIPPVLKILKLMPEIALGGLVILALLTFLFTPYPIGFIKEMMALEYYSPSGLFLSSIIIIAFVILFLIPIKPLKKYPTSWKLLVIWIIAAVSLVFFYFYK